MDGHDHGKPLDGLRVIGASLEPAGMDLGTVRTPTERFFVCSVRSPKVVGPDDWSLTLDGDGIDGDGITLSWSDLVALPMHDVDAWLECAGNGRGMYELAGGHPPPTDATDTPWINGAMGMARWRGPRLRDVLACAGAVGRTKWVGAAGNDWPNDEGDTVRMSMPIDKALHDDTIVAIEMNDAPLLRAHGAPARLLVPGWVGAYSVKWLEHIELSERWISSFRADTYYRHRDPDGTDRGPITTHPVKSTLALTWPATLPAATHTIRGYARCGSAPVTRLEVSIDDGDWFDIDLAAPASRWAWQPFGFEWRATSGTHQIRTRATDANGNSQPDTQPWHPNTVLWNAVTRHPITVE